MSASQDYQFELNGVTFGLHSLTPVTGEGFDPGTSDWRNQDTDNPIGPGRDFGRDLEAAKTWSWTLYTDCQTDAEALDALAALQGAWRAGSRERSDDVQSLTYRIAGRARRIYGRPRKFAYTPTNLILGGRIDLAATFDLVDSLTYEDAEQEISLTSVPAVVGGFRVPATIPWASIAQGPQRTHSFTVAGDAPTRPIITFTASTNAALVNPVAFIDDVEYGITGTIPAGQSLTIDTRIWAQTVLLSSGGSLAGGLTRKTRIDIANLAPGAHTLAFASLDRTGQASCTVSWRGANTSL